MTFDTLASTEDIQQTIAALNTNGINATYVATSAEAKTKLQELIPHGSAIMDMTSTTLNSIGMVDDLRASGNYVFVKDQLAQMDSETEHKHKRELGAAPDFAIGSVHAVTSNGEVIVASATGSQLPAYAYGAAKVIWVVGAQKLVTDLATGLQRIYEYVLPLEDKRAQIAYGTGSGVNKLLIINKEVNPTRLHMIIVGEQLGF